MFFSEEKEFEASNDLITELKRRNREFLNEFHSNSVYFPTRTQAFFGINKIPKWQKKAHILRLDAYDICVEELENLGHDEKLKTLEAALKLPLFTDHRNNCFFTGAYGRTSTQKDLERMYQKEKSVIGGDDEYLYTLTAK